MHRQALPARPAARKAPPAPAARQAAAAPRALRCSCGGRCPSCAGQALTTAPATLAASPGQALDDTTRQWMEQRFGRSFGGVRVHLDGAAQAASGALAARAFAVGDHLAFAPGQYAPHSAAGRRLLAHELAHTLQQGRGGSAAGTGAEHAADAAAAAVLRGRPVPAQPGHAAGVQRDGPPLPDLSPWRIDPSLLFAQPPREPYAVTRVENTGDDERIVHIDSGQRYRVWRHRWVTTEEGSGRTPFVRGTPGIDESDLWMTVEWCEGASEGSIRLSADAPAQVLRAIGNAVLSGGDIEGAVAGIALTPSLTADFRVGTVRFRIGARATVDTHGEVSDPEASVGVEVNTPGGRVGVTARGSSDSVGLNIEFTPGAHDTAPDCSRHRARIVRHMRVECQELTDVPEQRREITERVPQTDRRTQHLYFPYWSSRIDSRRSAEDQAAITAALADGFAVAEVRGFASPEGSRAAGRRFEGNDALSGARAQAALDWLRQQCGERGDACLPPDVAAQPGGERHTLLEPGPDGAGSVEVEGERQAEHAAAEFATDPAEADQRTPEVEAGLARARTAGERAAVVYPQLRRVDVVLTRTRDVERRRTEVTPARTDAREVLGGCPARLRDAAFPPDTERR